MNKDIKEKWVAALRSGKYKQGRVYLENNGKFCCLGVLCSLAEAEGIVERSQIIDVYSKEPTGMAVYNGYAACPPREIQEWAGHFNFNVLMEMNDEKRNRFTTIANYIEKNF